MHTATSELRTVEMELRSAIEKRIYTIHGQQVMLDSDLAMTYGVEIRVLNQAVKRNRDRFPEFFPFQLTQSETEILKSHFVISSRVYCGRVTLRKTRASPLFHIEIQLFTRPAE
jgi:hypothetical protein